jgi:UPF0755 protein
MSMNMKKSRVIYITACVLILFVIGFCIGIFVTLYQTRKSPCFTESVGLYIRPGTTPEQLYEMIPDSAVARPKQLRHVLLKNLTTSDMRPGYYVAEKGKPCIYVVRMLKNGWQTPVNLVLSGTMRLKGKIAKKISNQMMLDSASVYKALTDSAFLAGYGFTPQNVFSLIIPATYQVYWTDSLKTIFGKFKAAYDAFWTGENLRKAEAQGLTKEEVSILASIVKGESNYEPEYPAIAGVYLNRLHSGMKLQADPTIAFCFDYSINRILFKHIEVDSPYNTYKYEGLPPGPICVPDKPALNAVLNPDNHGYLYFCASPALDGTHKFARTLSEHNANAREFHRALAASRTK